MAEIVLLGVNHKTAPVDLRECLAFADEDAVHALTSLTQNPAIDEVLVISTCNRVEVLLVANEAQQAVETAKQYLIQFKNAPEKIFSDALYVHTGESAVRHVFRVASSLDSMVVGEPQILGQIKEAYRLATLNKASGVILNRLLHRTFFVAKKVRTETGIGDSAVSISYAATELAHKIFGTLEGKQVMLIGAGEMAELAVEHLKRQRAGQIVVANRTFTRAVDLATRFSGQAVRMEEIDRQLESADIVISSTGAPGYVVDRDQVKTCMRSRKNRPIFFIDIAVPRDIDPAVNRVNNAYVYDIDDLKGVVDENIVERQKEAVKGERIIDEAVLKFLAWYESLDVVPTIVALREKITTITQAELEKTLHGLSHLSESDREAFQRMGEAMVNKILHDPTLFLKGGGCHGDKSVYIDMARKLFNLDS